MGAGVPKQYLTLAGRRLIEHSVSALLAEPRVRCVVVAVAPDDRCWQGLDLARDARVLIVPGGTERWKSVRAGLRALRGMAADEDPVLVHDAARPCLHPGDLRRLLDDPAAARDGALLAVRVRDTLKRGDPDNRVVGTVDRSDLWQAQTPQMFPWRALLDALESATSGEGITDEASAMEAAGWRPRLISAHSDNLKVTLAEDLAMADAILARRKLEEPG